MKVFGQKISIVTFLDVCFVAVGKALPKEIRDLKEKVENYPSSELLNILKKNGWIEEKYSIWFETKISPIHTFSVVIYPGMGWSAYINLEVDWSKNWTTEKKVGYLLGANIPYFDTDEENIKETLEQGRGRPICVLRCSDGFTEALYWRPDLLNIPFLTDETRWTFLNLRSCVGRLARTVLCKGRSGFLGVDLLTDLQIPIPIEE
ncbi:MAG: hypothetical protein UU48_C0006G0079 [Candidatus Uhrbacteria bacterium GW2011_GWF2_41_16]|jgi:hypothetical protein|uniref:Uncharacterized protein n=2 Tax=Candidatus Uhriibacteriota TaxID=1752732 RepID=A0A0G0VAV3_9BACT|nr:MAG: hypothetical protein UU35_C0007G0054 [Candidatus Uhrbacteria bacterium GW2011_GWC2_41_11]KKR98039.1 MAG: hypothetical protein UU48_C0006G0079 [Candidatus Uhrbacteria bacterium GW2011_GWF2_41_16]HBO99690.1 hypothetical protein [Candidatus Uhrbacteria bacterium]